jgi:hypothetical protein
VGPSPERRQQRVLYDILDHLNARRTEDARKGRRHARGFVTKEMIDESGNRHAEVRGVESLTNGSVDDDRYAKCRQLPYPNAHIVTRRSTLTSPAPLPH